MSRIIDVNRGPSLQDVAAGAGSRGKPTRLRRKLLPLSLSLLLAAPFAFGGEALAATVGATTSPTGGVVVGGSGSIAQDGANTVINQHSAKLALDWQSFNLGKDAAVAFNQPSFSAVALNRILDQNASQILGRITSNGQVFLINTHGIIFGASARMNVGGLMASTLDLTPSDFLASRYNLDARGGSAGVVNHGLIQAASGGSVALVGGKVANDGVILANYGRISLDGADRAVLDFDGTGLISIQVTDALQQRLESGEAAVANSGTLRAEGGTVVLQASAAKDLFTNLVNNSGVIDAGGISTDGGVVRLIASGGNTENSGSIDVTGVHGGSVQLLSDKDVTVTGHAFVNASGMQGGGSIRVGGGVHGGEGLTQAQRTFLAPDASLRADALQSGNGGSVAVWSTGNTVSMGNISARGGAQGGNGGFVETSGLQNLSVTKAPNVGAANGVGGTWLIDPNDLSIDSGSAANKINTATPFVTTNDGASLGVGLITTALQNGDVTIVTGTGGPSTQPGNITVNSGFSFDGTGGTTTQTAGTLTLNAANDITFADNQIFAGTGSYKLSVDLQAGNGITFGTGSGITANGGSVTLNAAGAGIALGQIDAAGLDATAAGAITQVGALTISGASSFSAGANAVTLDNARNKLTGAVSLTGSDVALTNDMATQLGAVTATGTLGVTTTGALTQSGALSATGAATFTQNGATAAEQDITLSNTTLSGAVTFAGTINKLALTNHTATTLDGVTTAGTLDITSGGTLTQATGSTLSAGGAATFTQSGTTAGDQDIVLGNATLGDDVTFAGTIDNLTLTNATAITNLTVPNIAGDLSLAYTSGTLTWPSATIGTIGGSLTLAAGGGITLDDDITTTGSQTYNSDVTLGSNATLTGTDVNLTSGVTGAGFGLTIAGNATFGAASDLSALSVSGSSVLGSDVTTTGAQTYIGAVTLGNNVVLSTTDSAVSFGSTVDSFGSTARDLTVNAGAGGVAFGGAVGDLHALGALDTSGSDTATFAAGVNAASLNTGTGNTSLAGDVSTSGAQTYGGAVTLSGGPLTLASAGGDVTFNGTLDNASSATPVVLTVTTGTGAATFTDEVGSLNGALGGLTTSGGTFNVGALNVDGGLSVSTTAGDIGQSGAFTVTGTSAFDAGAHAITLTNTGNNFGGAVSLSNSGPHNVALDNGGNALTLGTSSLGSGSFSLTGSGALTLAGTLTTDGGAVSLGTPVTLGADSGIDTTNSGGAAGAAIGITGAVDGAHGLMLTAGSGAITLGAAVGSTTPLAVLTASGGSFTSGALDITGNLSVTTTAGAIGQSGAFTVGGTSIFNAGAHAITLTDTGNHFTGAVSLNNTGNNNVTLNNGTYALTLGTTSIGSGALNLPGSGALTLAGNLTTAGGALSVSGPVAFGGTPVTIDTTGAGTVAGGAAINFGGALTGTSDLILKAGTGGVATLGGVVGMGSLAVTAGGGIALNANVTTAGNQTYTGATMLGDDVTLKSTAAGAIDLAGTVDGAHALTVNTTGTTTFGGVVGGTANLSSLTTDASGGTTLNGNVTTTGAQAYDDDLTLDGNTTLKGSSVSLLGVTGGSHNLSTNGATTLGGALTGVGVLSITGTTAINTASVQTTGAQTYTGAVTLGNDVTLASTGGGDIGLSSTVDGTHALTVNTTGNTTFGGAVGGSANLASLTTNAGGGTTLNGDVTTSGAQAYGDTLTLGGDTTLTGSAVSLAGVTGGTHDLTTIGATTLGGALSGVGALSITGATTINTTGISTTGDQTYDGAVTLGADTVLTSVGTSGIQFTGTIDNASATARSLEVDATTGGATFGGAVGTGTFGPLAGLTVTTAGDISQAAGGLFKISGASSFTAGAGTGDITLDQANAFGNAVSFTGNDVSINNVGSLQLGTSTVGGTLAVTAGGSITQATGGAPLKVTGASTFTVTAAGADVLLKNPNNALQGAVTVATSGTGTVHDLWLINTSATAGNFTPPASITNNLTLDYANAALTLAATSLGGALDATSGVGITLNGNVTTGGNQGYHGAVTLGTGVTLDTSSGDGDVTFDGTVGNLAGAPQSLTVAAGSGAVGFGGTVGAGANPLGAISITGSGTTTFAAVNAASLSAAGDITLNGDVTTVGGTQIYGGAVRLNQATTLTGSEVSLGGVVGNNHALAITGNATLGSALGGISALTVSGTTALNASAVTTDGSQTYTGAVTLGADTVLTATNSAVTFGSTVDADTTARALTVDAGSGNVTFTGAVGTNKALGALAINSTGTTSFGSAVYAASLVTNSGGGTTLNGDVTTSGAQTYGDALTLNQDTALTGSDVTLAGVTGGTHGLDITGNAALNGALGGVGSLSVSGTTAINTSSVTTTGAQTYGGDITLTADTTLTGGAIGVQGVTGGANDLTVNASSFSAGGALSLTGAGSDLKITTTAGDITQTGGAFTVGGTSGFNAGTGDITLNQATNAFTDAVSLIGNNVAITNAGALKLGTSTVGGTLGVTAGDSITQSGALGVTGASVFTITAAATVPPTANVTLDDTGNSFGDVTVDATNPGSLNNFSLTNINSSPGTLLLNTSIGNDLILNYTNAALSLPNPTIPTTVNGKLELTAGGTGITLGDTAAFSIQTGGDQIYHSAVLLGNDTTLTATAGAITFDKTVDNKDAAPRALVVDAGARNVSFGGAVGGGTDGALGALSVNSTATTEFAGAVNAASLAITGAGGTTALGGNVTTTGAQSYGGAVQLSTDTTLSAAGATGDVTFAGTVDNADATRRALTVAAGGKASFAGAVGGGSNGALSTLTVTSNGDISQSAPFNVAGASSFTAGAHKITLGAANNFGGAVSLGNSGANDVAVTNVGALVLGNSSVGSGLLTLTGAGISQGAGTAISQAAGAATTTLNAGIGNDLVLAEDGNDFTGDVTATGKAVELKSANALTIASLTNAANSNVLLSAGGQLSLTSTINDIDTGTGDLTLESGRVTSGSLTLPGKLTGHNITLTSADDLTINNALTGTGAITLTSRTGDITQDAAGIITSVGGALAGTSGGSTTLNGADNKVATLGLFQTGGNFSFNNAQSLTVDHPVLANGGLGDITLTTTGAGSDLVLDTQIQGTNVALGAGGDITQTIDGTIQAVTLTGTSVGDTELTGKNEVGTLGQFTSGGNFSFNNATALKVIGPLSANGSVGTISLTTTTVSGTGADLDLATGITASAVTLGASGKITQTVGAITTATLTGNATGDVALDGANLIDTLGAFSAGKFSLVNAKDLTVSGPFVTSGDISLKTTAGVLNMATDLSGTNVALTSAGNLTLDKLITGTASLALSSTSGSILQSGGVITTAVLSGSSVGTTKLDQANNAIGTLGSFSANGFSLTNNQALIVSGPVNGGASMALTTTAGGLTINGPLSGTTTTLTSAGAIGQGSGGVITAATLTGSSAGDTILTGANRVGTLGNFSAANFSLSNAQALAVNGTLTTAGGNGAINLTTTSGTLSVNSDLTGGAVALTSAGDLALGRAITGHTSVALAARGSISQNAGGVITTSLLTGSSTGSTTLNQANKVDALGDFSAAGFALTDNQSLTVSGVVSGGTSAALTTTSGNLTINGTVKGNTTTLNSAGSIGEGGSGAITAATLTGKSTGATNLTGANNAVATLNNFTAAGFALTSKQALAVTGVLEGGASTALTTTAGDLSINGAVKGTATSLTAAGAINEGSGGVITAATLSGRSTGNTTLSGANLVGTLGEFAAAGFNLVNAQGLTVNGPLTTSGDVSLKTTSGVLNVNTDVAAKAITLDSAGDLGLTHGVRGTVVTLRSAGNISQASGADLAATTLTGSSVGSTTLDGSGSKIETLGDFSAKGFSLTNGQSLVVGGVVDGGASTALTTTAGDLTVNGTVKGTATTLTSAGAIGEGAVGVIAAATLTGSSAGATTLTGVHNAVGALTGFSAQGFSLTSNQALTVSGTVDGGATTVLTTTAGDLAINGSVKGTTTTLTSAGALGQGAEGTITAATLNGASAGTTVLTSVNQIGSLGRFTATNLDLTSAQALAVTGPVTVAADGRLHLTTTSGALSIDTALSGGDLALTSAGDLKLVQAITGKTVALVSSGNISQTDTGIVTADVLTGSSIGFTDLDPVNHVGSLGSFKAEGFSLASDRTLTIAGALDGGASVLLLTTNGADLLINGAINGKDTTLTSAGAISQGAGGSLLATTLTGSSAGATTLDSADNRIGTLNSFSADGFSLTSGQALTVAGTLAGGSAVSLTTTSGDLALNAAVSGGITTLRSAGAISEGIGGSITAATLTGSALGPTMLGSAEQPLANYIGTLGGFSSPAGFSLTNSQTLHLASVNGSAYTVDAGNSALYLAVTGGDLLQTDKAWTYDGVGTWSASGRIGAPGAPIYVIGDGVQTIAAVGQPPAYFYALDRQGNLLPLAGGESVNVPTSALTSNAQNTNNHTDSYIDPSVVSANYRSFGIVPSGLLLPEDQQRCAPDDQDCLNE